MAVKKIISTPLAPKAIGPYSQGVLVGSTYYFSGQLGIDPNTMELKKTFDEQLNQILINIDGLLESENLTRGNVVKTTIFLKNLDDFVVLNEIYKQFFTNNYPARSCVEVSRLPKDALVEIEVIAVRI